MSAFKYLLDDKYNAILSFTCGVLFTAHRHIVTESTYIAMPHH